MWLTLAFLSATLLGFYDVFKKQSLKDNAVLPVLFLNIDPSGWGELISLITQKTDNVMDLFERHSINGVVGNSFCHCPFVATDFCVGSNI